MDEAIFNNNKQATALLKIKNYQAAFALLSSSIKILKSSRETANTHKLSSLIYSNLSVLYKETGKLKDSIACLQKVIEIEKKISGTKINTVNAYLSLCSIYSSASEHDLALKYGLTGLILLQKEFPLPDKYVETLVIAYHNVGVEYEYLSRITDAVECYTKGWNLSKSRLGLFNPLTESIKNSLIASSKANTSHKMPGISTFRTNSQHAYKRSDLTESLHTGSTSSSGATDARFIATPRNYSRDTRKANVRKLNNIEKFRYKIDLGTQRNNERCAAVLIQAWWRGELARKKVKNMKIKDDLKKAAAKARLAYNEFKILKEQVQRNKIPVVKEWKMNELKKGAKGSVPVSVDNRSVISGESKNAWSPVRKETRRNSVEVLTSGALNSSNHVFVKSTNNRINNLKSRNKAKPPISLQQFKFLHAKKIIKIQSFFRMWKVRKHFQMLKKAAIVIQKSFRRYSCMRLYKEILGSIIKIQTEYKKYKFAKENYVKKFSYLY